MAALELPVNLPKTVKFCPRCGRAIVHDSSQCPQCLVLAVTGAAASPTLRRPCLPVGIGRLSNVLIVLSAFAICYVPTITQDVWLIGMVVIVSGLIATLAIALRHFSLVAYWLLGAFMIFILWLFGKGISLQWLLYVPSLFGSSMCTVLLVAVLLFFLLGHCRIYSDAVLAEAARQKRAGEDHTKRQVTIGATICAETVLLICWAVFPSAKAAVYAKLEARREAACRANMTMLAAALLKYTKEHEGKLPSLKTPLPKILAAYVADTNAFRCPKDSDSSSSGYLFNPELAEWRIKSIVDPKKTILISENSVRDASTVWHKDSAHYAFANGTVRLLASPSWLEDYKWVPDERINESMITAAITGWKKAWEDSNADRMISFYDSGFKGKETDRPAWLKRTRKALARGTIHVEIENLDYTLISDGEASVSFTQYYWVYSHSPPRSYADIGRKTLDFKKVRGQLLIVNEHFEMELMKRYPERTVEPEIDDYSFACPGSDVRTLYESDLYGKSAWDLDVIRNEIFARHGMIFGRKDIQKHFLRQPWYFPRPDFNNGDLNDTEKQNAEFIAAYQRERGLITH